MSPRSGDGKDGGQDVEAVFCDFVRNANEVGHLTRTARARVPHDLPPDPDPTGQVLLLTRRKSSPPPAQPADPPDHSHLAPLAKELLEAPATTEVGTLVPIRSEDMLQTEALVLVPDVASVVPPEPPVRERSEDGLIPAGELDRMLADMNVLLRYGHVSEVRDRLEELCRSFSEDLLLLRRISEFHLETGDREGAMEALFLLAGRLFERRNVVGMRRALEQVLVLDPENRRAYKLLGLLSERPSTGTGG